MNDWHVRPASAADADALALVGAATFLDTFADRLDGAAIVTHCAREHAPAAYRDHFDRGARAWLAEIAPEQAPVGYAMVTAPALPPDIVEPGDLELKRIYTLSRVHGTGIGAALMAAAIEHAVVAGAPRLLLGVYRQNHRALAFYARNGFSEVGTRIFRVGDQVCDDAVLARTL